MVINFSLWYTFAFVAFVQLTKFLAKETFCVIFGVYFQACVYVCVYLFVYLFIYEYNLFHYCIFMSIWLSACFMSKYCSLQLHISRLSPSFPPPSPSFSVSLFCLRVLPIHVSACYLYIRSSLSHDGVVGKDRAFVCLCIMFCCWLMCIIRQCDIARVRARPSFLARKRVGYSSISLCPFISSFCLFSVLPYTCLL